MKKILVTGADGQLGSELREIAKQEHIFEFLFTDYRELDITSEAALNVFFEQNDIAYIINCAAYTAVDKAESETQAAFLVNAEAPRLLGQISDKHNCPLIHVSTDYVFRGTNAAEALVETSPVEPLSVYGKSKLQGEENLQPVKKHIIIRTSWLYSTFGNNFVKTMIRLGREKESINVIFDQIGSPTYAKDLAVAIVEIIRKTIDDFDTQLSGIYHFSNEGACSWYDFAYEIKKITHFPAKVLPIETKDYPTPAVRPRFTLMNKSKIKNTFGIKIRHWTEALAECTEI